MLYVKPGGTGDGSSWEAALGDPQDAIEAAAVDPDITQVWVAKTIRECGQSHDFVASQKGYYIAGSPLYSEFSVYML